MFGIAPRSSRGNNPPAAGFTPAPPTRFSRLIPQCIRHIVRGISTVVQAIFACIGRCFCCCKRDPTSAATTPGSTPDSTPAATPRRSASPVYLPLPPYQPNPLAGRNIQPAPAPAPAPARAQPFANYAQTIAPPPASAPTTAPVAPVYHAPAPIPARALAPAAAPVAAARDPAAAAPPLGLLFRPAPNVNPWEMASVDVPPVDVVAGASAAADQRENVTISTPALRQFIATVRRFAPERERALSLQTPDGSATYKLWSDSDRIVYIQTVDNWTHHNNQMIEIRINARNQTLYQVNGVDIDALSAAQNTYLIDFAEKVAVQKLLADQKHVFNPNCLKFILEYLQSQRLIDDRTISSSGSIGDRNLLLVGVGSTPDSGGAIEAATMARVAAEDAMATRRAREAAGDVISPDEIDPELLLEMASVEEALARRAAGTDIVIWGSKERVMNPPGSMPAYRNIYKIHMQNQLFYWGGATQHDSKHSFTLDSSGTIIDILIEERPPAAGRSPAQIVYQPGSDVNNKLTAVVNKFLEQRAILITQQRIGVHRLALELLPEIVLRDLCPQAGAGAEQFSMPNHNRRVKFLTNALTEGAGTDAGGPSQDLVGTLAANLFAGTPSRTLQMEGDLPSISQEFDSNNSIVLANIGKFFAAAYSNEYKLGRVVGDEFFTLLRTVLNTPNFSQTIEPTDEQVANAVIPVAITLLNAEREAARLADIAEGNPPRAPDPYATDWIYPYAQSRAPSQLTDNQKIVLVELLGLEEDAIAALSPQQAQDAIKRYIIAEWKSRYRAAWGIAKGIPIARRANFTQQDSAAISTSIQGMAFNRETIANAFVYHGNNTVVRQKLNWMREIILDRNTPKEWIEQVLLAISGRTSVVNGQHISFNHSHGLNYHVHTCSKSIDIPDRHIDFDGLNGIARTTDTPEALKDRFKTQIGTIIGSAYYNGS